ncbi:MAG: hypothetical protein KL863_15430 [Rhizobium sp.]|nr:hypothetical protein [Rhizobium sp.]
MLHLDSFPIDQSAQPAGTVQKNVATPEPHILAPEAVDMPLPRQTAEQIVVPASINGRDLSEGQP